MSTLLQFSKFFYFTDTTNFTRFQLTLLAGELTLLRFHIGSLAVNEKMDVSIMWPQNGQHINIM